VAEAADTQRRRPGPETEAIVRFDGVTKSFTTGKGSSTAVTSRLVLPLPVVKDLVTPSKRTIASVSGPGRREDSKGTAVTMDLSQEELEQVLSDYEEDLQK
jgi:hypothetical protein